MSPHVYTRLSGFGWTLLPLAPFRFERVPGRPGSILAVHFAKEGPRRATLAFGEGRPTAELAEGTQKLEDVLDLLPGPDVPHWVIETSIFSVRWPESFALNSAPQPPGFDLLGPDGAAVYIQGPFPRSRLPTLTDMVGPGQTVRRHGTSARWVWVELEYRHEGTAWRQTHRVVSLAQGHACVVTSQAPERAATLADDAGDQVAESLSPMPSEAA